MKEILLQPLFRDTLSCRMSGISREMLIFRCWGKSVSSVFRTLKTPTSPYFTPCGFLKDIQALSALGLALLAGKGQGMSAEKWCGIASGVLPSRTNYYFHSNFKGKIFFNF